MFPHRTTVFNLMRHIHVTAVRKALEVQERVNNYVGGLGQETEVLLMEGAMKNVASQFNLGYEELLDQVDAFLMDPFCPNGMCE